MGSCLSEGRDLSDVIIHDLLIISALTVLNTNKVAKWQV